MSLIDTADNPVQGVKSQGLVDRHAPDQREWPLDCSLAAKIIVRSAVPLSFHWRRQFPNVPSVTCPRSILELLGCTRESVVLGCRCRLSTRFHSARRRCTSALCSLTRCPASWLSNTWPIWVTSVCRNSSNVPFRIARIRIVKDDAL